VNGQRVFFVAFHQRRLIDSPLDVQPTQRRTIQPPCSQHGSGQQRSNDIQPADLGLIGKQVKNKGSTEQCIGTHCGHMTGLTYRHRCLAQHLGDHLTTGF
jgi:hypothetical protein